MEDSKKCQEAFEVIKNAVAAADISTPCPRANHDSAEDLEKCKKAFKELQKSMAMANFSTKLSHERKGCYFLYTIKTVSVRVFGSFTSFTRLQDSMAVFYEHSTASNNDTKPPIYDDEGTKTHRFCRKKGKEQNSIIASNR